MKLTWSEVWKIIAIIVLAEITFLGGIMFQQIRQTPEKEIEYITKERVIREPWGTDTEDLLLREEQTSVKGIGIHPDNETGKMINFTVSTTPGRGDIFIKTNNNHYDSSFQLSTRDVKDAVEEETGKILNRTNLLIHVSSEGSIKGSSGSLSLGIALKQIITREELEDNKAATGVLTSRGSVRKVSLLDEKIEVAKEKNIEEVLIPASQCEEYQETPGIEVTCVNNLEEAFEVMKE